MRFTLYYRGPLRSNARPAEKHQLRKVFHSQLRIAWSREPLLSFRRLLVPPTADNLGLLHNANGFTFAPLVARTLALVAELDILMLWPQEPGAIVSEGGDIDNRLKTLFDSLRMPIEATALPPGTTPALDEDPFFCLLEDDRLITRVNVETDHLMDAGASHDEVALFIRVTTRQLRTMIGTIGLS